MYGILAEHVKMTDFSGGGDPARSLALLWRKHPPQGAVRGRKPVLSVDLIATAAIAVADSQGLTALSMRAVADRLGAGAMSLYTHVPGKAELLDVMLDTVYAELLPAEQAEQADDNPPEWRNRLELIAREHWALYERHPWVLHVATNRPTLGPNALARYEHELRAVDGIGLSDVEMDAVLTLVTRFVQGAARGVAEAREIAQRTGLTDAEWWQANVPLLSQLIAPDRYPLASRVGSAAGAAHSAAYDPAHAFEFGLQRVLDGIAVLIARPR